MVAKTRHPDAEPDGNKNDIYTGLVRETLQAMKIQLHDVLLPFWGAGVAFLLMGIAYAARRAWDKLTRK